jgi:hypothetical protein
MIGSIGRDNFYTCKVIKKNAIVYLCSKQLNVNVISVTTTKATAETEIIPAADTDHQAVGAARPGT